ncbi:MAG: hypothetical protein MJA29_09855 [Candidatus Omnitrophica bacterium]|nr:hypothetical protein [Candidatus Omnitrophota bacterium]
MARRRGPAGVEEQGKHTRGSLRNLGELLVSIEHAGGAPDEQAPGPAGLASGPVGNEQQDARWYRRDEGQPKRGGMAQQQS